MIIWDVERVSMMNPAVYAMKMLQKGLEDEMRILIDTNILFSAALYPQSTPQRNFP